MRRGAQREVAANFTADRLARSRRGAHQQVAALEQRWDRVLLHRRHHNLLHPIRQVAHKVPVEGQLVEALGREGEVAAPVERQRLGERCRLRRVLLTYWRHLLHSVVPRTFGATELHGKVDHMLVSTFLRGVVQGQHLRCHSSMWTIGRLPTARND